MNTAGKNAFENSVHISRFATMWTP